MNAKVRKQIYITPQQEQTLKRLTRLHGASEAEIIRQAIDKYARGAPFSARDLTAWQSEKEYIRAWMAQGVVEGGRTWRREDLHER